MQERVGLTVFGAAIVAVAIGVLGAAFDPTTPVAQTPEQVLALSQAAAAGVAGTPAADSSIGFPVMAWRVPDHPAWHTDGFTHRPDVYDFVRVYVGALPPDACIIVHRSTALNQERCYRAHNYVEGEWATLPVPKNETIEVTVDGTVLVSKMRVRDLREVAYGH